MLDDDLKNSIQSAYSSWLDGKTFKPRRAQRLMIAKIANILGHVTVDDEGLRLDQEAPHVGVIEAGTGTGKTIAYTVASIPVAKKRNKTLVISTATVALQEQLLFRDLPALLELSGLDFTVGLAKGRRRYLCLSKLDAVVQKNPTGVGEFLFPDEEHGGRHDLELIASDMNSALEKGAWDGDRDNWPDIVEDRNWRYLSADASQCSGRKCSHFRSCCLFLARDNLRSSDVVIANHDLVLADLHAGNNVLPPPEDCIYIFDEAHHLAAKAQNHFSNQFYLNAEKKRLQHMQDVLSRFVREPYSSKATKKKAEQLSELGESLLELMGIAMSCFNDVYENSEPSLVQQGDDGVLRFVGGVVAPALQIFFEDWREQLQAHSLLAEQFLSMLSELAECAAETDKPAVESYYAAHGEALYRGEQVLKVIQLYVLADDPNDPPMARWLRRSESNDDVGVCVAPLVLAEQLARLLWENCFASILSSATFSKMGQFEASLLELGLPAKSPAVSLEGQLRYAESMFVVPRMESEPANVAAHTEEVIRLLPELLHSGVGHLVLFASRRQMEEVYEGLDLDLQQLILMQGDRSKQALIAMHREQVDEGNTSVLFGLASFSEGIDLPGSYCEQVIIAKLPFSVPTDPLSAAHNEWLASQGRNAFYDLSLPDVSLKLRQACGRLLRSEKDIGRVILLDKRLCTKNYGQRLIEQLPPFQLELSC